MQRVRRHRARDGGDVVRLSAAQRDALAELLVRHGRQLTAEAAVERQIERCWQLHIPASRIAASTGLSIRAVQRHCQPQRTPLHTPAG